MVDTSLNVPFQLPIGKQIKCMSFLNKYRAVHYFIEIFDKITVPVFEDMKLYEEKNVYKKNYHNFHSNDLLSVESFSINL